MVTTLVNPEASDATAIAHCASKRCVVILLLNLSSAGTLAFRFFSVAILSWRLRICSNVSR